MTTRWICSSCDVDISRWVRELSQAHPVCPECGAALDPQQVVEAGSDADFQIGCGAGAGVALVVMFGLWGWIGETPALASGIASGVVVTIVVTSVLVRRRRKRHEPDS